MVVTGFDETGFGAAKSEVIDLMDPSKECLPWVDFPITVMRGYGTLVQDEFVIYCGGWTLNNVIYNDKCYKMGPSEVTEINGAEFPIRQEAAANLFGDSLFVSGGYGEIFKIRNVINNYQQGIC